MNEDEQKQLSFDLRVFEDKNILFVILGIWKEKNRLSQFNGDLLDRVIEIPVEPWNIEDFKKVIKEGEPILKVNFNKIVDRVIESSFGSIGVLQELCKECCYAAGIKETQKNIVELTDNDLNIAIAKKVSDYSTRHIRCVESFIEQKVRTAENDTHLPLFIPYYFIRVLFSVGFNNVIDGIKRKEIQEQIKAIHHRPNDIRSSDLSYFLYNMIESQIKKSITPPIFDFDRSTQTLRIIDSTFYFFIFNYDKEEIIEIIDSFSGIKDIPSL